MSPVGALSLVTISIGAMVALVALRVGGLPGWGSQRWLAAVTGGLAAYAVLGLPLSASPDGPLGWAIPWAAWLCRVQLALVAATLWAWSRCADGYAGRPAGRLERAALWLAAALGVGGLVPGVAFHGEVGEALRGGLAYHLPATAPLGGAIAGLLLASFLPLAGRFASAWRAGIAGGGLHAAAVTGTLALGGNDALVTMGWLDTPYLLDHGVALVVAAVGMATAQRLVREAGELACLRGRLEAQVEDRTKALARFREALHRAEKLAVVGELAAGVAHEVNSPATAAIANVEYLLGPLRQGRAPADAVEAGQDALTALRRITEIVRRLSGAARLGSVATEAREIPLGPLVRESVRLARARCPGHVRVDEGPGGELVVLADDGLLVQVLVNLVVNGAQAVPTGRPGRVEVSAARRGSRVVVTVEDDGAGMRPEVLERVFEPFFTTKPVGVGTGLGLSISRGLLASIGGELTLASEPGRGTRAHIELPAAAEPELRRH